MEYFVPIQIVMSIKFSELTRAQIVNAIYICERDLLTLGVNQTARAEHAQKKRAQLFAVLREKDDELLRLWKLNALRARDIVK